MWYKYKGFDSKGNPKNGYLEGVDDEDVIKHLRTRGIFGVKLEIAARYEDEIEICDASCASKEDVKTVSRQGIIKMRFNYEELRQLLRSILLDVGVTEDTLRDLIIKLKSEDVEKQRQVIEYIESMGFKKEALELSKAFLFRTDFNNTQNPEDFEQNKIWEI